LAISNFQSGKVVREMRQTVDVDGITKNGFQRAFDKLFEDTAQYMFVAENAYETFPTAMKEANLPKNRYKNIFPFDHTRVILPIVKEDESTDYINANFISGLTVDGEHAYIATQGPLPYTIEDFWRMVISQKCKVIVMLTQFVEAEKQKCGVYFLDDGDLTNEELTFNSFSIKVISTVYDEKRQIKKRSILIDEKHTKTVITHFQYIGWPDLGIPDDPTSFDELLKMANESNSDRSPMVVHCSAGVGRTGTFIAVNNAVNYVEHQRKKRKFRPRSKCSRNNKRNEKRKNRNGTNS